jgi:hypothetical protein
LFQKRRNVQAYGLSQQQFQQVRGWEEGTMNVIEAIVMNLAVLAISGASAVGLGHLFLSVVVKDRRSSS